MGGGTRMSISRHLTSNPLQASASKPRESQKREVLLVAFPRALFCDLNEMNLREKRGGFRWDMHSAFPALHVCAAS